MLTEANRKWWTLGAVTASLFMITLDNTVVNVALPAIQRDLDASVSQLEWTVNAYVLAFAVCMLAGGKLADLFGRRLIFTIGLVVFAASSLLCALASSGEMLILWRAVQGVGSALMLPATLSIISATFDEHERGTAIGIWAGISTMALAIGPLVGGALVDGASWSWIFYINVPVGIVGAVLAPILIRESRDMSAVQRLDVPGLLASGIGLFGLTYALIEGNTYGWGSTRIVLGFVAAALGLAAFVVLELRGSAPLIDLALFRNPTFTGANCASLLFFVAIFGMFFFLSLYLQNVQGYSPTRAGAAYLPLTVLIMVFSPVAGKLADRHGARWPMAFGLALVTVAMYLFSRLPVRSDYAADLLPACLLCGIGFGLASAPMAMAVLTSVTVDKSGVASGVLNTFRQVGGALGIAVMGALVAAQTSGVTPGPAVGEAFVDGIHDAFLAGALASGIGAVLAAALVHRARPQPAPDAAVIAPDPAEPAAR